MEKMMWAKPEMNEVAFAANEYVAACNDLFSWFWEFICNAGGGNRADIWEGTYHEDYNPNNDGTNLTPGTMYFHACGAEKHYVTYEEGKENEIFTNGWYDEDEGNGQDYKFDVTIWKGEDGKNVHATTSLVSELKVVKGNRS